MFDIIFENNQILIINKPSGLVVNRSQTTKEKTLQDMLGEYFGFSENYLGIGDRAGIVHRLDRETSGLLIVAKTTNVFEKLQAQFKNREVEKNYIGLVHGFIKDDQGSIEGYMKRIGKYGKFGVFNKMRGTNPIYTGGVKEAVTGYKKISNFKFQISNFKKVTGDLKVSKNRLRYLESHAMEYSLVEFYPKTGRTHQIRVHAKSIGHPVVSDLIYEPSKLLKFDMLWCPRLFLHAKSIKFKDPESKKVVEFHAELPAELTKALNYLTTVA